MCAKFLSAWILFLKWNIKRILQVSEDKRGELHFRYIAMRNHCTMVMIRQKKWETLLIERLTTISVAWIFFHKTLSFKYPWLSVPAFLSVSISVFNTNKNVWFANDNVTMTSHRLDWLRFDQFFFTYIAKKIRRLIQSISVWILNRNILNGTWNCEYVW